MTDLLVGEQALEPTIRFRTTHFIIIFLRWPLLSVNDDCDGQQHNHSFTSFLPSKRGFPRTQSQSSKCISGCPGSGGADRLSRVTLIQWLPKSPAGIPSRQVPLVAPHPDRIGSSPPNAHQCPPPGMLQLPRAEDDVLLWYLAGAVLLQQGWGEAVGMLHDHNSGKNVASIWSCLGKSHKRANTLTRMLECISTKRCAVLESLHEQWKPRYSTMR